MTITTTAASAMYESTFLTMVITVGRMRFPPTTVDALPAPPVSPAPEYSEAYAAPVLTATNAAVQSAEMRV